MHQALIDISYFALGAIAIVVAGTMLKRHGESVAIEVCPIGNLATVRAGIWIIVTVFLLASAGFLFLIPAVAPFPEISATATGWQAFRQPILTILPTAGAFILLVAVFYTVAALVIVYRGTSQMPPPPAKNTP